jgi:hypothetical protein
VSTGVHGIIRHFWDSDGGRCGTDQGGTLRALPPASHGEALRPGPLPVRPSMLWELEHRSPPPAPAPSLPETSVGPPLPTFRIAFSQFNTPACGRETSLWHTKDVKSGVDRIQKNVVMLNKLSHGAAVTLLV